MQASPNPEPRKREILSLRDVERLTAALLVLYCIAQVITIVTRIASSADQPDAMFSIAMISANHTAYLASKVANMAAAFLLLGAGVLLYLVFSAHDRALSLVAASLLVTAAIFWMYSSLAGLALAEVYGKPVPETAVLTSNTEQFAFHAIEPVRAMAGRVGFTAVALGLAALGALIALAGPLPRWLGWTAWAVAIAMFFIWDPEATAMHRVGGGALLVWLLALAGLLAWKGTQNSFPKDENP